jgi:hypothetical protein
MVMAMGGLKASHSLDFSRLCRLALGMTGWAVRPSTSLRCAQAMLGMTGELRPFLGFDYFFAEQLFVFVDVAGVDDQVGPFAEAVVVDIAVVG